jgi:hypothetical protein
MDGFLHVHNVVFLPNKLAFTQYSNYYIARGLALAYRLAAQKQGIKPKGINNQISALLERV